MADLAEQLGGFAGGSPLLDGDNTRVSPPSAAEMANEIVAPGRPADFSHGIFYHAEWKKLNDGIARHSRENARALASVGIPTMLRSISDQGMTLDSEVRDEVWDDAGSLVRASLTEATFGIHHFIAHNADLLKAVVCPAGGRLAGFEFERAVYKASIVYTSWERTTVNKDLVNVLNRCGEVWVPCKANAQVFLNAGVRRVGVIPAAYDPSRVKAREDVPEGRRFYQVGKWEPRKNQHALIGAFLHAFKPKEKVSLLIKTTPWGEWKDYPQPPESLAFWETDAGVAANGWTPELIKKRVVVTDRLISEADMDELHRRNNIYVSAAHGEAWELGAFAGKCAGNRLVYVPWAGPEEFAEASDVRVCGAEQHLSPAHPGYGWEPDAQWTRVTLEDLTAALRQAKPPERRVHPPSFPGRFGHQAVGRAMVKRLMELDGPAMLRVLGAVAQT